MRESTFWLTVYGLFGALFLGGLLLLVSCATVDPEPHPTPEQMPQGRVICKAMCASVNREYEEYRYDGKCVCAGAK